jgi:hypothetical protein
MKKLKSSPDSTQKEIDFSSSIKYLLEGKKIHKLEWKNKEFYGALEGGTLKIHKPDGNFYQWILNDGDMLGKDYIVL